MPTFCIRKLGDSMGSGRETRAFREHRTEVTEATEDGFGRSSRKSALGWTVRVLGEKHAHRGEHRTEVTEATEDGLGWLAEGAFSGRFGLLGEKHAHRGEHRTEVTEATEDGFGMADGGGF